MAFKYKETKNSQAGMAHIKFNSEHTKAKVEFADGSFSKIFGVDDFPEHPNVANLKDGDYSVAISNDQEEIWRVSPVKGSYIVKTVGFNHQKDADPEPKTFPGKYGDFQMFGVILEIQKGRLKGARMMTMIPYAFDSVDGLLGLAGNPETSKFANRLATYLELAGVPDNLPYEDNPLPTLQEIIVRKGNLMRAGIDNVGKNAGKGYIGTLLAYDDDEDDFPEFTEPKVEPKKEKEVDVSLDNDGDDWDD